MFHVHCRHVLLPIVGGSTIYSVVHLTTIQRNVGRTWIWNPSKSLLLHYSVKNYLVHVISDANQCLFVSLLVFERKIGRNWIAVFIYIHVFPYVLAVFGCFLTLPLCSTVLFCHNFVSISRWKGLRTMSSPLERDVWEKHNTPRNTNARALRHLQTRCDGPTFCVGGVILVVLQFSGVPLVVKCN